MKRFILFAGFPLLCLVAALLLFPRADEGSTDASEPARVDADIAGATASAQAQPHESAQEPTQLCAMNVGDTGTWRVRHAQISQQHGQGPETALRHHKEGTLVARILQLDEEGTILLARFDEPSLSATPRDEETFAAPFLLRLDEACGLQGFAYHHRTPRAVARMQQALAWELSFRYANDPGLTPFDNGFGPHLRAHAMGERDGRTVAHRSIRQYTRSWSSPEALTPEFSLLEVTPGTGLWFERAEGQETLANAGGQTVFRFHAERIEDAAGTLLGDASPDTANYRWDHLLGRQLSTRRPERAITEQDMEAWAVLHVLDADAALDHVMGRVEQGEDWSDVLHTVSLWLEARPDQTMALVEHIAAGGLEGQATNTLYVALGLARTPEAHAALHDIMEDEVAPPFHRMRAMLNLLDRDDVGLPLAQQIAEQTRPLQEGGTNNDVFLARQSMLALGTLGAVQQNPEIIELAEEVAFRALTSGGRAGDLRPAFGTLANLGNPEHLAEIAHWSHHPDWEYREAAARVFRRMHPEDTEDFVVDWLSREPSTFVRAALWTTLSRQHLDHRHTPSPALLALAAEQIHQNMPVGTQRDVIRIVGAHADSLPELRDSLIRLAREERRTRSNLTNIIARHLSTEALLEVFE